MKTNAIVRIALFLLAILVLISILLAGLFAGQLIFTGTYFTNDEVQTGPIAELDGVNQYTANANDIRELEIEWAAGSITIIPAGNTTQITVSEPQVAESKYQMICMHSGDKLSIQFCEDNQISAFGININTDINKDLEIVVPTDWVCEELSIDAAAATVEVRDLMINNVDFDGASGICTFENCIVEEIDLDAASGDVKFSGTLNTLCFDGMSASCYLELCNTPERIDVSTMSGDLDITLPDYCGFTVSMDSMSSDFASDFPTTITDGHHVHGDGSCHINVDAMSGDVNIHKGVEGSYTGHHHEDENHF